jgi:hypothetical protein
MTDNKQAEEILSEEWKDVIGHEGKYQLSSYGRLKSLRRIQRSKPHPIRCPERLITAFLNIRTGYYYVRLYDFRKVKTMLVHRLLAIHFIPNPEGKPMVNHIDGVKTNNKLSNLEWCTAAENIKHSFMTLGRVGSMKGKFGSSHNRGKGFIPKKQITP